MKNSYQEEQSITYLVIKCGNSKAKHAANELDAVIEKNGFSWFAKFGAKIRHTDLSKKVNEGSLVVCLSLLIDGGFQPYFYQALEFKDQIDQIRDPYPPYYNEQINLASTWIKVKKLEGIPLSFDQLIVKSSLNPVLQALRTSTAGFFLCKKK